MKLFYDSQLCLVATKHGKETAISPSFETLLGCQVKQAKINTDLFGTFTGEVERKLSPRECAKEKCLLALSEYKAPLGIASEGSFGPHPQSPFINIDHELLFFADLNLGFELTLSKISLETNFSGKAIEDPETLSHFAEQALFPSHALIVSPHISKMPDLIFKGIQNDEELYRAFNLCLEASSDRKVQVQTDMRAHMNPTRMRVIAELAHEMAIRLATPCPYCQIPGWGAVKKVRGLVCRECDTPTELVHAEIYGCCLCQYQETIVLQREKAEPSFCPLCNP